MTTTKIKQTEQAPSNCGGVTIRTQKPMPEEIAEKNLRFAVWANHNHKRLNDYAVPYYLNDFVGGCITYVNTGINKKVIDTNLMETQIKEYYAK